MNTPSFPAPQKPPRLYRWRMVAPETNRRLHLQVIAHSPAEARRIFSRLYGDIMNQNQLAGAPARLTDTDRANMASAERVGNIRTLDKAATAIDGIIGALNNEGISTSTRAGLHVALGIVSDCLAERAEFLIEQQEVLGFGGGDDE